MREYNRFLVEMGERVFEKRKKLGWSQETLAEKADTSKQTVSSIERGERDTGAQTLARLANALGVSTDYLLIGQGRNEEYRLPDMGVDKLKEHQFRYITKVVRDYIDVCGKDAE